MRTWRMQMELQLDDLHTESQVSEHRQTAASLRDHFYQVCQECERYRGFCEETQITQSSTSLDPSRFEQREA